MSGRLSAAGEETSPVTFSFTSQRFGEGGRISATLPNGEKFSGTYLQITSTTGGFAEESQAYENPEAWDAGFGDIWNPGGDVPVSHQDHSAKVIATLSGNRGDTMHCGFRLNNPKQGMARGGTGKCLVSSGGTIKV